MKMVSMAQPPENKSDKASCCACAAPGCNCEAGEKYPWGLRISLEGEQLEALAMKAMPVIGSTMTMTCEVRVTGCREDERQDGTAERCLSLQITSMGVDDGNKLSGLYPTMAKEMPSK